MARFIGETASDEWIFMEFHGFLGVVCPKSDVLGLLGEQSGLFAERRGQLLLGWHLREVRGRAHEQGERHHQGAVQLEPGQLIQKPLENEGKTW